MISVVLLNWQREEGVRQVHAHLSRHGLVDELIVWNNNPETELALDGATVINSSADMGLFTRFAAASLARNECVLHHDDDLVSTDEALETVYANWRRQPDSCHALFGRLAGPGGTYQGELAHGPVEIVLTRFAMTSRRVCVHALTNTPRFAEMPGVPVGNGEDIILSYAAMDVSRRANRSYPFPITDLGQDEDVSIHKRYAEHNAHRSRVIRRCREVFGVRSVLARMRLERRVNQYHEGIRRRMVKYRRSAGSETP